MTWAARWPFIHFCGVEKMSIRWVSGLACALAFAEIVGCAAGPFEDGRGDRVAVDAVDGASDAVSARVEREPARGAALRTATGGPVLVRVDGARVERVHATSGGDVTAALLDGDGATSLESAEPMLLRVRLDRPRHIVGVAVVSGPAHVEVSTSLDGASASRQFEDDVVDASAWQRLSFSAASLADTIELRWTTASTSSSLREIELWAEGAPSEHVPGTSLASEIVAEPSRFGRVSSVTAEPVSLSPLTYARDRRAATVRFAVVRPTRCVRTFFRYELEGIAGIEAVPRTLNGARVLATSVARRSDERSIVAEEIPSAALRAGDNELTFEPIRDASIAARIRRIDVVCVEDVARATDDVALSAAQRATLNALTDGVAATSLDVRSRNEGARWVFGVPSQIHSVSFFSPTALAGRLELATGVGRAVSRVSIPLAGLRQGWNHVDVPSSLAPSDAVDVRFAGGREASGSVSELHVVASPLAVARSPRVVITHPTASDCVGSSVYVRGFIDGRVLALARAQLELGSMSRELAIASDGSFSTSVSGQVSGEQVAVRAVFDGQEVVATARLDRCPTTSPTPYANTLADTSAPFGQWVRPDAPATLEYAGLRIEIPAGAVEQAVRVTVHPIERADLPTLDPGMDNVTKDGRAFRLGPHGIVFSKPLRITVPWSARSLPAGMRDDDVNVFYFDAAARRWRDVPRLASPGAERVLAATNHFTDYIAATRSMPETPQAAGFDGNTIRGIRDANPLAGVPTIAAPSVNPNGVATTTFPIQTPAGRNGIQPSLSIDYNSDGENGWLGVGWDLKSSFVDVDTRNGVPTFAMEDAEAYRLDGAALVCVGPARGDKDCSRRVDGERDVIRRRGTWPDALRWEVVRDGVTYSYGTDSGARLTSPYAVATAGGTASPIVRWYLQRVEDSHGNFMLFEYAPDNGARTGSAGDEPFRQMYLHAIHYTGHRVGSTVDLQPNYHVTFAREEGRSDTISSARFGFETLTRTRLKSIQVKSNGTIVRQYSLTYMTGDFGKSLLESIAQRDANGDLLYEYTFDYHTAPSNGVGGVDVGPGNLWATAPVTHPLATHEGLRGGANGFVGVGPPAPSFTVGAGLSVSGGTSHSRNLNLDLNADGLADLLAVGSPSHSWEPRFGSRTGGVLSGHTLANNPDDFSKDPSESFALNISIQGPFGIAGVGLDGNIDFGRAHSGFFDADGDGWPDHLTIEPVS
jgi:hypothetical protein